VVVNLSLDKTGSRLLITDDARRLRIFATDKWTLVKEFTNVSHDQVSFAPLANLVSVLKGRKMLLIDMADGAEKAQLALPDEYGMYAVMSPDARRAVVISTLQTSTEEKLQESKWPKDLPSDLEKEMFRQEHDGSQSRIAVVELPTGKILAEQKAHWFTAPPPIHGGGFKWQDDGLMFAPYNGPWVHIDSNAQVKMLKAPAWCNYGLGWSLAGDFCYTGSLATYVRLHNGKEDAKEELAREQLVPGFPEYFHGFGVEADGSAYAVTSAHRMARIDKHGKVVEIKPYF